MKIERIVAFLAMAVCVPVCGQEPIKPHADRFVITNEQVARTICGKGVSITTSEVSLLANVVAAKSEPELDIVSVEPFGDRSEQRSLIRFACRERGVCLPFYAIAKLPEGNRASTTKAAMVTSAASTALKPDAGITIRAGSRATLVMDDDRSHIRVAVISLENGATGHTIRVASPDHKQFYMAEVVSATMLRRSF